MTVLAAVGPARVSASDTASAIAVEVQVSARTSLHVSTDLLQFNVTNAADGATASVDFTAAARVVSGSGVVLNVEPVRSVEGPGGAADVETEITFSGDGSGALDGTLTPSGALAGKWQGSGQRTGRLVFTLHASAPGVYTLPVRLVLSTP